MTPERRAQIRAWADYHDAECSHMQACCTMATHLATDAIRELLAALEAAERRAAPRAEGEAP